MSTVVVARTTDSLRDVHGRGMNTHSDVYKLPADAEEHDRLTIQHRIWKLSVGGCGLYPIEVEERIAQLLAPRDAEGAAKPSVLDLGCGSGIWAIEMAEMYPQVNVTGLDLAEPKIKTVPDNYKFLTIDASKGLDDFAESFDVVHCRCVAGHVVDRPHLMHVLAAVLKPGGLLLLGDGNGQTYAPDGAPMKAAADSPDDSTGSWMSRWLGDAVRYMQLMQKNTEKAGGEHLELLVRDEPSLAFLGKRSYYNSVVPKISEHSTFSELKRSLDIAHLTKRNMLDFLTSSRPILLSNGMKSSTVDEWQRRATSEIVESPSDWCIRWDLVWASKKSQ